VGAELRAEAERAEARDAKLLLELEGAREAERRANELASAADAKVDSASEEARRLADAHAEAEQARRELDG
jgi:hypothetical protein